MMLAVLLVVPLLVRARSELDLLSLDDETPRVLGVQVPRSRLLLLCGAVLLTGAAVAGVGVITFVGPAAPHDACALVGSPARPASCGCCAGVGSAPPEPAPAQ
jgi:ferric hydroxamate transport system permease protein